MKNKQLYTSKSEHWCTPVHVIELLKEFKDIGLDPCSNPFARVDAGHEFIFPKTDALEESWAGYGLVYCNPPYGRKLKAWTSKIREQAAAGVEIIALTPARTDTLWFHEGLIPEATALLFWKGRMKFRDGLTGEQGDAATFPSLLTYLGPEPDKFLSVVGHKGLGVKL